MLAWAPAAIFTVAFEGGVSVRASFLVSTTPFHLSSIALFAGFDLRLARDMAGRLFDVDTDSGGDGIDGATRRVSQGGTELKAGDGAPVEPGLPVARIDTDTDTDTQSKLSSTAVPT